MSDKLLANEAILKVLRESERPLTVVEIRHRIGRIAESTVRRELRIGELDLKYRKHEAVRPCRWSLVSRLWEVK